MEKYSIEMDGASRSRGSSMHYGCRFSMRWKPALSDFMFLIQNINIIVFFYFFGNHHNNKEHDIIVSRLRNHLFLS